MPIVIDGNNFLHSLPGGHRERSDVRRQALEAVRGEGMRVTVVFDGPPPAGSPSTEHLGRVTIAYSGSRSADDVIIDMIPGGRKASQFVVVSNDRGLCRRARELGASSRSLAEWRRRARPRRPPGTGERPLSSHEVAEWERFFASGGGGERDE